MTDPETTLSDAQLHAFVWQLAKDPPPETGEGADEELARMVRDLPVHFREPLPAEFRLGPETYAAHRERVRVEGPARMQLVEDGPYSKRPKTAGEKDVEAKDEERIRKGKVIRFYTSAVLGVSGFFGSQFLFHLYRNRHADLDVSGPVMEARRGLEMDWRLMGGFMAILVAAWFLADAYVMARELWLDWTKLKAAVPVIGKKWAEKSKKKLGD
ncbi:MAG: hypothetical protein KDD82_11165 [Planctomycetes bacterium]|nr:hypothetical protein [Planctomycetota bacterium]